MTETGWQEATDEKATPITADLSGEWQEVEAEKQIAMESLGDGFMARLIGIDPPNANGIVQSHWEDVYDLEAGYMMQSAFFNLTRDLINKLKKVPLRSMVRIQWTDNLNTGHSSGTPMRVHDVRWKR